jgi:hypothetical protein
VEPGSDRKNFEIYDIFHCPRCKNHEFNLDRKLMMGYGYIGICKASGLMTKSVPEYGLDKAPPRCRNFENGRR